MDPRDKPGDDDQEGVEVRSHPSLTSRTSASRQISQRPLRGAMPMPAFEPLRTFTHHAFFCRSELGGMMLVTIMALALAQAPEAAGQQQAVHEAAFRPLKKSERIFARLGPVGPYYPQVAVNARRSGEATLRCRVAAGGELEKCKPVAETPANSNFGVAARVMADRKRIFVEGAPAPGETILVRVPFVLGGPATVEP